MHACYVQVRRVLDTIRGRSYEEALILMEYMPYKACEKILKALISVRVPCWFVSRVQMDSKPP